MANRRCFSKDIVCSDEFYDLPISTQALYFHLGMQADDRGYVNNARTVIKITGASIGDLELLVSKKFVLLREDSKLILIKGWRINNTIQPSRLIETKYTEDLKKLFFDENNSYTENPTSTSCQQIVDKVSTQYNLIKDNLNKDNLIVNIEMNEMNENINAHACDNELEIPSSWDSSSELIALDLFVKAKNGIELTDIERKYLEAYEHHKTI